MNVLQLVRLRARNTFSNRFRTPLTSTVAQIDLRLWGANVAADLRVSGRLRLYSAGSIEIADQVRMNSGPWNNFVGGDRQMAIWVGPGATLSIGRGCALSNTTIVCTESIRLHEEVFVGGGCEIYDTDFHHTDPEARVVQSKAANRGAVEIGPRAFIGGWTTILKNARIGEGAVIGARSLVTGEIPPFELWAGVPARRIRALR